MQNVAKDKDGRHKAQTCECNGPFHDYLKFYSKFRPRDTFRKICFIITLYCTLRWYWPREKRRRETRKERERLIYIMKFTINDVLVWNSTECHLIQIFFVKVTHKRFPFARASGEDPAGMRKRSFQEQELWTDGWMNEWILDLCSNKCIFVYLNAFAE